MLPQRASLKVKPGIVMAFWGLPYKFQFLVIGSNNHTEQTTSVGEALTIF